jgi:hypothetical protein
MTAMLQPLMLRGRSFPFARRGWNAAFLAGMLLSTAAPALVAAEQPAGRWRDVSLDDYRKHLVELTTLTEACAKARDMKSCDPTLIGPDDRVPSGSERRVVRYGWLRLLFSRAEESDEAANAPGNFMTPEPAGGSAQAKPPTTSQLLQDAQVRLAADRTEAEGTPPPVPAHSGEQAILKQVLAGREFRDLKKPDVRDTAMEHFVNWLNHVFAGFGKLRTHSAWLGWALTYGFLAIVCAGLVLLLLRLERRWRVRLVPDSLTLSPGAASARDWQLWLADARRAAASGAWREAIHFVYWAAISRLESKRLWPADRARTPREYLALVADDDPRRHALASLTGDFERIWYGGRNAGEIDYRRAEHVATELIGSTAAFDPQGGAR